MRVLDEDRFQRLVREASELRGWRCWVGSFAFVCSAIGYRSESIEPFEPYTSPDLPLWRGGPRLGSLGRSDDPPPASTVQVE